MNVKCFQGGFEYFRTDIGIFVSFPRRIFDLRYQFNTYATGLKERACSSHFLHFAGMILNSPHANWNLLLTAKLFSSVVELFAIEFKSLKLLWLGLIWRKKFCNSKRRKDLSHFRWTSPSFTLKEEGRELEMHGTTHIHRGEGAANIKSWTTPKKFFLSPFLFNAIWARSSMIFFWYFEVIISILFIYIWDWLVSSRP